jgi:hypothetical protein
MEPTPRCEITQLVPRPTTNAGTAVMAGQAIKAIKSRATGHWWGAPKSE